MCPLIIFLNAQQLSINIFFSINQQMAQSKPTKLSILVAGLATCGLTTSTLITQNASPYQTGFIADPNIYSNAINSAGISGYGVQQFIPLSGSTLINGFNNNAGYRTQSNSHRSHGDGRFGSTGYPVGAFSQPIQTGTFQFTNQVQTGLAGTGIVQSFTQLPSQGGPPVPPINDLVSGVSIGPNGISVGGSSIGVISGVSSPTLPGIGVIGTPGVAGVTVPIGSSIFTPGYGQDANGDGYDDLTHTALSWLTNPLSGIPLINPPTYPAHDHDTGIRSQRSAATFNGFPTVPINGGTPYRDGPTVPERPPYIPQASASTTLYPGMSPYTGSGLIYATGVQYGPGYAGFPGYTGSTNPLGSVAGYPLGYATTSYSPTAGSTSYPSGYNVIGGVNPYAATGTSVGGIGISVGVGVGTSQYSLPASSSFAYPYSYSGSGNLRVDNSGCTTSC